MQRRKWMGLFGGFCLLGGGEKKKVVDVSAAEKPWIAMKDQWEQVSGGEIEVGDELSIGWGETLTNVRWKGEVPTAPFELEMKAKRVNGTDFFCAVTFPARGPEQCVTLIVGGWGGSLVGISCIDGKDASENDAQKTYAFMTDVWYQIRLVREGESIKVWIDGEKFIDVDTTGKSLSLRQGGIEECAPFGLATWQTTARIKDIRWRGL
ncbi:MAG: family 16 glycoside hydrolase [Akkermansiaceae bacterium]